MFFFLFLIENKYMQDKNKIENKYMQQNVIHLSILV